MRISRALATVAAASIGSAGLLLAAPAHAAVIGQVTVNPTTGDNTTSFGGSLTAACPTGTNNTAFFLVGGSWDPASGDGFLGNGTGTGIGAQSFAGANIANLNTVSSHGNLTTGSYQIVFMCNNGATTTDTYAANFAYNATGSGSWTVSAATLTPVGTSTALSSDVSSVELGSVVNLTAQVTPASGSPINSGSVEFFDGATSLGSDSTVVNGQATFAWTSTSPTGAHSLTAVFHPAAPSSSSDRGYATSTSAPSSVTVNPVAARSTSSVLSVTPTPNADSTGTPAQNAYSNVTLTCAVTASTGTANGFVTFLDGSTPLGSVGSAAAPTTGPFTLTTNAIGAGQHSLTCSFTGTAPYQSSASAAVPAYYAQQGATPDPQTVTVTIPVGSLTISTPYHPGNALDLGAVTLDAATSTYSASAQFGSSDPANGPWITINDTRAGNLGWRASLIAGAFSNGSSTFGGNYAGLTNVHALQVAGNALQASNVTVANTAPNAPGLGAPAQFASYPAGSSYPTGTAHLYGTFGISGVPTSITPGLYTSTVTFTAQ